VSENVPSLQDAVAHFQSGRLADADAACRAILSVRPGNPVARLLAGEVAVAQHRNAAAVEHFRVLAQSPATPVEIQHRACS